MFFECTHRLCLLYVHCDIIVFLKTITPCIKLSSLLSYASRACWGFFSAADRCRIEAFRRISKRFNFRTTLVPSFNSTCASTDSKSFNNILYNKQHFLYPLLLPECDDHIFCVIDCITFNYRLAHRRSETYTFQCEWYTRKF